MLQDLSNNTKIRRDELSLGCVAADKFDIDVSEYTIISSYKPLHNIYANILRASADVLRGNSKITASYLRDRFNLIFFDDGLHKIDIVGHGWVIRPSAGIVW